jgi:hypothetical protein
MNELSFITWGEPKRDHYLQQFVYCVSGQNYINILVAKKKIFTKVKKHYILMFIFPRSHRYYSEIWSIVLQV